METTNNFKPFETVHSSNFTPYFKISTPVEESVKAIKFITDLEAAILEIYQGSIETKRWTSKAMRLEMFDDIKLANIVYGFINGKPAFQVHYLFTKAEEVFVYSLEEFDVFGIAEELFTFTNIDPHKGNLKY